MRSLFFVLLVMLLFTGCSHIPFVGNTTSLSGSSSEKGSAPSTSSVSVKKLKDGQIVNALSLRNGKKVAVTPFKAGIGVVSDQATDKASLMIIKGISDVFDEGRLAGGKDFQVITAENLAEADFFIQGRITRMVISTRVSRWVLWKRSARLSVEGKMVDARTGEVVAVFNDSDEGISTQNVFGNLAHQIGRNIGSFIMAGVQP